MPFHISPEPNRIDRRGFFAWAGLIGATYVAGNAVSGSAWGAEGAETTRIALLSDTHIHGDPKHVLRDVNMSEHLAQAWEQVGKALANSQAAPLQAAIVHGDVACTKGELVDYRQVAHLLTPAGKCQLPLHFLMGNHDHRENFREVLSSATASLLESHLVSIIQLPQANWFLLDSLEKTNSTPGLLGKAQLDWLAGALDAHADKPALVSVHHHPQWMGEKIGGIQDTSALFDLLVPRKQVKAVFFGHTHVWTQKEHEGIHLVNLPPIAYVFDKALPSGWVEANVKSRGMELTLHGVGPANDAHGKTVELAWR
jgi:Icc protein